MAESRELKSALLTKEVLSVEAGIEIDFRTIDSICALERGNWRTPTSMPECSAPPMTPT